MIIPDLFFYIFIAFACSALMAIILYSWILKHIYEKDINVLGMSLEERKSKHIPLGGMVLVPCVIVGVCLSMVLMSEKENLAHSIKTSTLLLGCGVISVYLIGLLKDLYGLPVRVRLLIQILAALTLPLCGLVLSDLCGFMGIGVMSLGLSYPLTVLIIVAVVNAVNMLDGIEGLLSSYAMLCMLCFGLCFHDSQNMVYCLIAASMVGGLIVFFCRNAFGSIEGKSKIDMGNSGSLTLGFSLAYLTLKFIIGEETSSFAYQERMLICFSLLFVPCIDLVRVFFERILRADRPFSADQRHLHHMLINSGVFGRMTLLAMMSVICFFLLANLSLAFLGCSMTWIAVIDILCYVLPCSIEYEEKMR